MRCERVTKQKPRCRQVQDAHCNVCLHLLGHAAWQVFLDGLDEEDEQMQQQQQQLPQQQQQQQHLQQQQPIGVTRPRRKPALPGTEPPPHYIFCSNTTSNATAERTARALQQRMAATLAARGLRPDEALYRLRRLHFVLPPCQYVSPQLRLLLDSWPALPGVNTVLQGVGTRPSP